MDLSFLVDVADISAVLWVVAKFATTPPPIGYSKADMPWIRYPDFDVAVSVSFFTT